MAFKICAVLISVTMFLINVDCAVPMTLREKIRSIEKGLSSEMCMESENENPVIGGK